MKIGNPLDLIRTGQPTATSPASTADNAKAKLDASLTQATANGSSSSVKVSSDLAALTAETQDSDAFDSKRVEQLKAAIADGSFKVNAEAVADKMISSNVEALTRSKP